MDSDTSDDMASGSKARDRGLKGDKVPQWKAVSKTTFEELKEARKEKKARQLQLGDKGQEGPSTKQPRF